MYLHIGTYSGHLISYQGLLNNFTQLHNFQASESSIRCLARSSKYLLAGGYDQLLYIYSIHSNIQQGEINCQQGAIVKIRIIGDMFLTAGEDGSVAVWKLGTWERVHRAKEHKGVEVMDVHPSGKLMITIGKEKKLILWNLLKFMRVMDVKLDFEAKKILFGTDQIWIVSDIGIYLLDTSTNQTLKKLTSASKIQDALIYQSYLITSHQNGQIKLHQINNINKDFSEFYTFSHGKIRVKCLGLIGLEGNDLLVSADSEGQIKFWHLPSLIGQKFEDVGECVFMVKKVGQRVICLSAGMEGGEGEEERDEGEKEWVDEQGQGFEDYQQEEEQEVQQKVIEKKGITKKINKKKNFQVPNTKKQALSHKHQQHKSNHLKIKAYQHQKKSKSKKH